MQEFSTHRKEKTTVKFTGLGMKPKPFRLLHGLLAQIECDMIGIPVRCNLGNLNPFAVKNL